MLNADRRHRIKEIVQAALDVAPAERAVWLDHACAGDADLRREVDSLLEAEDAVGDFLDEPAHAGAATTLIAEPIEDLTPGERIGPYRVLRELGSGGMGAVYQAVRDDEFKKHVAIKVVKRGMDSNLILRRFRRERQILAGLNHPNIATLFDGGTSAGGLPYLVMEYVEGTPITEYCDAGRLNTRQRLELFETICSAVHYAHQNLVVHRDLKPSNILITLAGIPKLLDFGIAKILNPDLSSATGALTVASMRVMTPEYASPEQVRGGPITTASDVYSLGVLLYELLTGRHPYRLKTRSLEEVAQVVCHEEPLKPSTAVGRSEEVPASDGSTVSLTPEAVSRTREGTPERLRKRLRGDLDNIVLMALRKEPQRRYASAERLSEDIRRYLERRPVMAQKDTPAYRVGKFVERHKAGVLAAALVTLSLIAGIAGTTWQAHLAGIQRSKAERRFNDVRKLARSVLFELHDGISTLPGSLPVRELLVKRALEYLDSLAQEADGDTSLQLELASAYERVGRVQGGLEANLGNSRASLQSYRKALAIRLQVVAAEPSNRAAHYAVSVGYSDLAGILAETGDVKAGLEYSRKALAVREQLFAAAPGDIRAQRGLAIGYTNVGMQMANAGDWVAGLEIHRKALAIYKQVAGRDTASLNDRRNLALGYKGVGAFLGRKGLFDEALENYRSALAIDQSLSSGNPHSADARMDISNDFSDIGWCFLRQHRLAEALRYYENAFSIREALAAADPNDAHVREGLGVTHNRLGDILLEMGNASAAMDHFRRMITIREKLANADTSNAAKRISLGVGYATLGNAHLMLAKKSRRKDLWREARSGLQRSLDIYQPMAARGVLHGDDVAEPDRLRSKLAEIDAILGSPVLKE